MNIFEFAIQMERDGQEYYNELASKTPHPGIQKILNMLAADELRHQQILEKIQTGMAEVPVTEALDNAKNVFQQMRDFGGEIELTGQEESLYHHAIELEEKSISFYLDRSEQADTPQQQALLGKLAEEEKKHRYLLECLLDFFVAPKTWLEDAEFQRLGEY
jgi:rubrerythrin